MATRELTLALLAAFPAERALGWIEELSALDRFQASAGIDRAADRVAAEAERVGLTDVTVHRFAADGARRWWTFRAPRAWTPRHAELVLIEESRERLIATYPDEPLCLATYSTPAALTARLAELAPALPDADLAGAIAVVPANVPLAVAIARATAAGAAGLVAAAAPPQHPTRVGRIELAADSALFAWSVSPARRDELLAAARRGLQARTTIEIERTGSLPIVEAVLPGDGRGEVLLTAHLCHPRPGANDNLSGVAALLGIAESLRALATQPGAAARPDLRFVWGPEFTGTAAYLGELAGRGGRPRPAFVLNLDMVGENPHQAGGPLIVERAPSHLPTPATALLEHCLDFLPLAGRSYSGAVEAEPWTYRSAPFVGASDHGPYGDRAIGIPALQLGHWPDRFNHSSEDTLDKIDLLELRRSAAAAAATALLALPADRAAERDLRRIVARWGALHLQRVVARALEAPAAGDPAVVAPFSRRLAAGLLAHTAAVAADSLPGAPGSPERRAMSGWIAEQHALALRLLPDPAEPPRATPGPRLTRRWQGPWNLFGLLEDAAPADAAWLRESLGRDKGAYARFAGLAAAIDGESDRETALREAAYATELELRRDDGDRYFDVLLRAGWIAEGATGSV